MKYEKRAVNLFTVESDQASYPIETGFLVWNMLA